MVMSVSSFGLCNVESLDWNEFMNYMLIENNTLNQMKKEDSEYVKSIHDDFKPTYKELCHAKNITCMIVLKPEDMTDMPKGRGETMSVGLYKKQVKFATGAADGTVKIWTGTHLDHHMTIKVADYSVTAISFMTFSKKLVVATTNRMISFYDLNTNNKQNIKVFSRFENLVAVPLCLEYYRWPANPDTNKNN